MTATACGGWLAMIGPELRAASPVCRKERANETARGLGQIEFRPQIQNFNGFKR
jgi:hypothetical protein